jgi:CRP-like cAMP-binding protein
LIDNRPRAASITAVQDSSVTELFKDGKMEAIVRTNPGALLVIIKVLAKRLRKIIQSTEEIGY